MKDIKQEGWDEINANADKDNKKLTLVRDPYGKKPLLYSINNNIIAFASDLRSLENIIDCGEVNPLAVESLFKYRFILRNQ